LPATVLALVITATVSVAPARAGVVIIHASALGPPALSAIVGERVTFVNESGRPVHVEFGVDPDRHHVFQVADRIWAVFHRPGPHGYAVHVTDGGDIRELRGVVEIVEGAGDPSLPQCPGFATVMGTCLAP
jgi:hypothetical protein